MKLKNILKFLTRNKPKLKLLIRNIPLIPSVGLLEYFARSFPDTFYPIRDKNLYEEISSITIKSIEAPYREISSTIGKALGYVYGCGVSGDIVEFGTQTGRSAIAITSGASYLNGIYSKGNDPRGVKNLYFFDSFIGLPKSSKKEDTESPQYLQGIWSEGACKGYSSSALSRVLKKYKKSPININVIEGWFKETVPLLGKHIKFSFVHVDGDLYESAIDCLEPLFLSKKISEGAIVLFDDWNCNRASPNFGERKAFDELCQKYKIKYSIWSDYAHHSKGFIIHSYS